MIRFLITFGSSQMNEFEKVLRSCEQNVGLGCHERCAILRKQCLIRI